MSEAALRLTIKAQKARIAELENAARRAAEIIDRNLYHQSEKVEDAATLLRAALGWEG